MAFPYTQYKDAFGVVWTIQDVVHSDAYAAPELLAFPAPENERVYREEPASANVRYGKSDDPARIMELLRAEIDKAAADAAKKGFEVRVHGDQSAPAKGGNGALIFLLLALALG